MSGLPLTATAVLRTENGRGSQMRLGVPCQAMGYGTFVDLIQITLRRPCPDKPLAKTIPLQSSERRRFPCEHVDSVANRANQRLQDIFAGIAIKHKAGA